jgi:AcrR family transcriptional regulator
MGRPSKFSVDEMLDAAAVLLADGGPTALTAAGVARQLSAPSGSLYHRFGSRDELAAALWMRTVERFDAEVVSILDAPGDPVEVAVAAARRVVAWTGSNPLDALILTMFRRDDLTSGEVGGELAERARTLGRRQLAAIARLAGRVRRTPDEVTFAVAGIPMAAVRGPIERRATIPDWVGDAVERAVRGALTDPTPSDPTPSTRPTRSVKR